MHSSHAKIAIDTIPSSSGNIESRNKNSDSISSDSERSRTMRVNREQLYTESVGCNIASDSASFKSSQSQIHANHVVFLPHYPDSLVNYTFEILTAHSDIRITTRIGIYPKYPVNLSFRIIDLYFGIANLSFCIDSVKFGYTTGISGSTPSSGNMEYPLQWKLRVDPSSGNMVVIRQTPPQWKYRKENHMAELGKRITYKGHSIIPVYFAESKKTVFDLYMGITYTRFIGTWDSVEECKQYVDRPTRF